MIKVVVKLKTGEVYELNVQRDHHTMLRDLRQIYNRAKIRWWSCKPVMIVLDGTDSGIAVPIRSIRSIHVVDLDKKQQNIEFGERGDTDERTD